MEEFKVITLPGKNEENEAEDPSLDDYQEENYEPPKKRYFVIPIFIILLLVGLFVARMIHTYDSYDVEYSWERKDSTDSQFISFKNNVIKYSNDGIFYTKYDGNLIWNYTYDMTNPTVDIKDSYIIVYDKNGTEVDIFSDKGFVKSIGTTTPISLARVAGQGTVALLLQEDSTSYIQMYDTKGNLLVSGEMHPENKGFPVAMALSSDGTKLLMSVITSKEGDLSSQLILYDFSDSGREKEDNIAKSYTYVDMIIPDVEFVKNDKILAFGDSKIIIFNNNDEATIAKEISLEEDAKSVFYNDKYFGYTFESVGESGQITNRMKVYNLLGFNCFSKDLEAGYETVDFIGDKEVLLKGKREVSIYNIFGFKKFTQNFEDNVYRVVPGSTYRRYYLIKENNTEEIILK
ncbi:MAG: DUF5711 family protein [Pseudobutyrivibrio sp.]|nr:DUF5711 family protein [Pseudobutyrivibrio sp.]